ncbi:MAG: hypothetical protein AAGI23_16460 [Bacteroidota bacterium]
MNLTTRRSTALLGGLTYLALALLALIYFKERTAFLDVSYRIFQITFTGEVAIQANRFGELMTQWIPLVGTKLELPLSTLGKLYSVGVIGYFFVLFLVCLHLLKQPNFALTLVLFNVFIVSYTFFWMQIELAQGIAFTILFFAWLKDKGQRTKDYFMAGCSLPPIPACAHLLSSAVTVRYLILYLLFPLQK